MLEALHECAPGLKVWKVLYDGAPGLKAWEGLQGSTAWRCCAAMWGLFLKRAGSGVKHVRSQPGIAQNTLNPKP
eukprot:142350-Chlamydomonas_euryale.AAC.1